MIEIGVFHNGASDLPPIRTPNGVVVNDGTLADVHASNQRIVVNQVRQGILADRLGFDYWFQDGAPLPAGGRGVQPEPALERDGDRGQHAAHPPGPSREHHHVAPPDPLRGAGRHARRALRRPRGVRDRAGLSAARERDLRQALRLDHPGSGAQPRGLPGGLRHDHQGLDGSLHVSPRGVLLDPSVLHQVESRRNARLLRPGQGGARGRGRAEAWRARPVLRREPRGGHDHDAQGDQRLPTAAPEAAPADVGAAHEPTLPSSGPRSTASTATSSRSPISS